MFKIKLIVQKWQNVPKGVVERFLEKFKDCGNKCKEIRSEYSLKNLLFLSKCIEERNDFFNVR